MTESELEAYNERAAKYEYDAGFTRAEAEKRAMQDWERERR